MLILGIAGTAQADYFLDIKVDMRYPATWVLFDSTHRSQTWVFDLNNDALYMGDIDSYDKITRASFFVDFKPAGQDGGEKVDVVFDNLQSITPAYNSSYHAPQGFHWDVFLYVGLDHLLNLTLENAQGDFCVYELRVEGDCEPGKCIPEPTTMLLIGSGLLGLGVLGRRSRRRS
jgi:hypothetical protein